MAPRDKWDSAHGLDLKEHFDKPEKPALSVQKRKKGSRPFTYEIAGQVRWQGVRWQNLYFRGIYGQGSDECGGG